MEIVIATANPGKLREIRALLRDLPVGLSALADHKVAAPPENGQTFIENALIKARHATARTGLPALADDSGLEVEALGGRPGVRSARFAGEDADDEDNRTRLLAELAERAADDDPLHARFRCVAVFLPAAADAEPCITEGAWRGRIQKHPSGAGGFGYDPVFFVPQHRCTAAELDPETKNALSHRGQAMRALYPHIVAALQPPGAA